MARMTLFIVACLMSVVMVTSKQLNIPTTVDHMDRQCHTANNNYIAACSNQRLRTGEYIDCQRLYCMHQVRDVEGVRAMYIGRAKDGTRCARNSVCLTGICTTLPTGRSMPRQIGRTGNALPCYWANGGKPR